MYQPTLFTDGTPEAGFLSAAGSIPGVLLYAWAQELTRAVPRQRQ